jgi:uncharacterized protein (DUF433 family)
VTKHPELMHGTPCFSGTRVPVKSLFDHLAAGYNVDHFLYQFPTVQRQQVDQVLESACEMIEGAAIVVERRG